MTEKEVGVVERLKKKTVRVVISVLCAAVLVFSAIPFMQQSVAAVGTAVTTGYLNMREGPGTNYRILQTLSPGAKLTVLDGSDNAWVHLQTSAGKKGYCSRSYLKISGNTSSSSGNATGKALDNVRLRSGPGTSYTTLTTVPKGTTVKVVDNSNTGWVKVTYSGLTGYCSRQYMSVTTEGGRSSGSCSSTSSETGKS